MGLGHLCRQIQMGAITRFRAWQEKRSLFSQTPKKS